MKLLKEVHRVLEVSGYYILVSYGKPEGRLPYLEKCCFDWSIETLQIESETKNEFVYIYIMQKRSNWQEA